MENGLYRSWVLDRAWLFVDPDDDSLTPHLIAEGMWEAWVTTWFLNHLTPEHAVMDVGANMGYYSMLAGSLGCPVKAFEPQCRLARLLKASAAINGYDIQVHQVAIADTPGEATLYVPQRLLGGASIMGNPLPNAPVEQHRVPVQTLDQYAYWEPRRPLLVKVDAEGAEIAIWHGMQQLWARPHVTMLLEWEWCRYAQPEQFAATLMRQGTVTVVGYDGYESPVCDARALQHSDWITLVIRNAA